ncbi:Hypothetical predicted protein [Lecanosticta acicola]|uniref:Uncharacterized protein n=1 Tax=Lecanosticta acicola TaxID=111012 RepID=A0AAI8YZ96_9PEZI|nr:Hypothetical predicted protein [Lecanosticta acicola]
MTSFSTHPQQYGIDTGVFSGAQAYKPHEFGHPHQEAPPQPTDPFWWQHPSWTMPNQNSYYYPGYGFFDRPLYLDYATDGRPVVVGYGRKLSAKQGSGRNTPMQNHIMRMVSVYNGDDFVQKIPLKLLFRFSDAARQAFPKPPKGADSQRNSQATQADNEQDAVASASMRLSPDASSKSTSWADEVSSIVSTKGGPSPVSTESVARSSADTAFTDFTYTKPAMRASPARSQSPAPFVRTIPRDAHGHRMLKLDLQAKEMPTNQAVADVLKWMKDNEDVPRDGRLLEFAPPNLDDVLLENLVDYYQAVLALGMMPFPHRLRKAILDRITREGIDFETFRNITGWVPSQDVVVTRAINVYLNLKKRGAYTSEDLRQFEHVLSQPDSEELQAKVEEIRNTREVGPEELYAEKRQQEFGKGSSSPAEPTSSSASGRGESSDAGKPDGADQPKTGRRRRRRDQQKEGTQKGNGRGLEGRHVPGAD